MTPLMPQLWTKILQPCWRQSCTVNSFSLWLRRMRELWHLWLKSLNPFIQGEKVCHCIALTQTWTNNASYNVVNVYLSHFCVVYVVIDDVVEDNENNTLGKDEIEELNRARNYVKHVCDVLGNPVFKSVDAAIESIIDTRDGNDTPSIDRMDSKTSIRSKRDSRGSFKNFKMDLLKKWRLIFDPIGRRIHKECIDNHRHQCSRQKGRKILTENGYGGTLQTMYSIQIREKDLKFDMLIRSCHIHMRHTCRLDFWRGVIKFIRETYYNLAVPVFYFCLCALGSFPLLTLLARDLDLMLRKWR